jgi:hypothetical protein
VHCLQSMKQGSWLMKCSGRKSSTLWDINKYRKYINIKTE